MKEYVIGIDIGTSGTKTVLFDRDANPITAKTFEYPLYQEQNGWAEQEPEDWWNAVVQGVQAVLQASGVDVADIKGIGLSGQMHGLVMLDENGEVLRRQNITKHHLLIVDQNGDLSALTDRTGKQGLVANKLEQANTWQTFEFGPVLVQNGEAVTLPNSFYVNCHDGYYEPRTAIGQLGPLHYIVIVVDGRREGYSTGASIPQLQQLFLDEGAEFAFNLDGGGSTTLYFRGEVINMPSGGKERSVSDIIMFTAK